MPRRPIPARKFKVRARADWVAYFRFPVAAVTVST